MFFKFAEQNNLFSFLNGGKKDGDEGVLLYKGLNKQIIEEKKIKQITDEIIALSQNTQSLLRRQATHRV